MTNGFWSCSSSVSNADLSRPQGAAHIFARQPAMASRKSTTRSLTPSPVRDQQRREPDPSGDQAQTPNSVPGASKLSSRHRSDSVATSTSTGAPGAAKRVTGWVSSVGRSRKNSVSKKNFQSLDGDDSDADEPRASGDGNAYGSEHNLSEGPKRPTPSRPGSVRIRRPPPPPVDVSSRPSSAFSTYSKNGKSKMRTAQAIYDFHATATGELAFEKGDIIRLLKDEPLGSGTDGWVKGELKGQIGLIPFNYTREIPAPPVERSRTNRTIMKNDDPTSFDSYSEDDASNSGGHGADDDRKGLATSRTPFDDDRAGQEQSFFPPPNQKSSSSPDLFLRREHLNASTSLGPSVHDEFHRQHPINKQHHAHRYQNEAYSPTHDNFGYGDSDGGDSVQEVHRDQDGLLPPSSLAADSLLPSPTQRPSMNRRQLSSIITTGKKPPPPPPVARRTQTSVGGTYGKDNSKLPPSQRPLAPPRNRTVREQGSYDSFKSPFDA
jgi:SH3 domain